MILLISLEIKIFGNNKLKTKAKIQTIAIVKMEIYLLEIII